MEKVTQRNLERRKVMEGSIVDFTIFGWILSQEQIRTNFSSKRVRVMTIRTAID